MWLDLYQAETARIAGVQAAILQAACSILHSGRPLTDLERAGTLHALQVGTENAIGKAKQWLKAGGHAVPISAYDAFHALVQEGHLAAGQLPAWNAAIGLRNRIIHDYMNLDMQLVETLIREKKYQFIIDFLQTPYPPGQAGTPLDAAH